MYWIGLQPGDMHLNISSPGWAKHAYSCFFAPWNAGATVFIANQPRFNARGMLDAIAAEQRHHDLRAAHGVAHVRAGGHEVLEDVAARGLFRRRAAEPRDHRAGAEGLGSDRARGLRPDRDDPADRLLPGRDGEARLDGPGGAGLPHPVARSRGQGRGGRRGLHRARSRADRADARLPERRWLIRAAWHDSLSHRRRGDARHGRLLHLCRPRG